MTTPIATKPTRSSNSRIGKMTIDIPVGDITDAPLVASPTDTPGADGPRSGNNTANESEVAITPLGNAKLRGKSYLALSKHFDAFTRALNKPEKPAKGPGRAVLGKGASAGPGIAAIRKVSSDQAVAANGSHTAVGLQRTGTMLPGQGMDGVLAGCRFCIPPDHAGLSKHKQRWDIVCSPSFLILEREQGADDRSLSWEVMSRSYPTRPLHTSYTKGVHPPRWLESWA